MAIDDGIGCDGADVPWGLIARLHGIGRSSVFDYLSGELEVPVHVERLITLLPKHGVPKEWRA